MRLRAGCAQERGAGVTPDDLAEVQRTWSELQVGGSDLHAALTARLSAVGAAMPAERAAWLLGAIANLVDLLSSPSRLAERAREVVASWPDPGGRPSYAVDGVAWAGAAASCVPDWSAQTALAWRHGWLLVCEIMAAETLSPFRQPSST
jgi:hypothetical protein